MPSRALSVLSVAFLMAAPSWAGIPSRSLLLITIDTLRADYLGCNGSSHAPTPNLDRIATEGVNFARARASVPLTLPSHASILTATYPPTHTVRDNGGFRLPADQVSLAEVLEKHGFRSIAIVGSFVLDHRYGLNQGFEVYDDRVWSEVAEIEKVEAERSGDEVLRSFQGWMSVVEAEQRFFAWVHLYDPHAPYLPPEPYRSRYQKNPYAGEVAYTDEIVGKLLDELSVSDRLDRTIVAVVGDHGEGLGEHGESTHSLLIYNSTLHVPMMIRAPGIIDSKTVVDRLVRTIDLAPTLLDLLDIQSDLGEGVSLTRLFGDEPDSRGLEGLTAYSESLYPEIHLGWAALYGLETEDYRLISGPDPELFAVSRDRRETRNLVDAEPEVYQRLQAELAQVELPIEFPAGESAVDRDSAVAVERLRSLGYLAGSSGNRANSSDGRLIDPREKIASWNEIQQGVAQYGRNDFSAAAETFERILGDNPEILLAYEYLGASLVELAQPARAEQVYRRARSLGLDSARLRIELGKLYLVQEQPSRALPELERAVEIDEWSAEAHYFLGNAYRAAKTPERAAKQYRLAVSLNPSYLWAWNGLGMTLAGQGADAEALRSFRRAVDVDPSGARGYFNLAVQLERMGSTQQAIEAYRRFLELSEDGSLAGERALTQSALERLDS